jgi:hypothetical protein
MKLYSFVIQKFSGTCTEAECQNIFIMSQSGFHKVLILPFKWWFSHAEVVASSECVSVLKVVCSQFAFIINFCFLGLAVMHSNATLES